MAISLGRNIASLGAQRVLAQVSDQTARVYERLASGQRIQRASDDAAGLAIASTLNVDSRIYGQAIRNVNDGLSLLNVAEGALGEMGTIALRLTELASQAANGAFTIRQRRALDEEAQTLAAEYFRLSRSTKFNGLSLFDGSFQNVSLQVGRGGSAVLQTSVGGARGGGEVARSQQLSLQYYEGMVNGDLNNDGNLDLFSSAGVSFGRGDGTFSAAAPPPGQSGAARRAVALADVNNDGSLDLISRDTDGVRVNLNSGSGTFEAAMFISSTLGYSVPEASAIKAADLNGDGNLDLLFGSDPAGDGTSAGLGIAYGTGNGTFGSASNLLLWSDLSAANLRDIEVGDLNRDGILDIGVAGTSSDGDFGYGYVRTLLGNAQGTYTTAHSNFFFDPVTDISFADLNGDGRLDLVSSDRHTRVSFGDGTGRFDAGRVYGGMFRQRHQLVDIDGDGDQDLVTSANGSDGELIRNDGRGVFSPASQLTSFSPTASVTVGDFNNDGVPDLAGNTGVFLTNTVRGMQPLLTFSLETRAGALQGFSEFRKLADRLTTQRSEIGTSRARAEQALGVITAMKENITAAAGRILDADVAFESSLVARLSIIRESGAAVLAQANQQPQLAIALLRGSR